MRKLTLALLMLATPAFAGEAEVVAVDATESGGTWRFDVTIAHADTGWEHYADGWAVLTSDGTELGYRKLLHPHVEEQPFTRSLSGVAIPAGVTEVFIRADDNVHGEGTELFAVTLD
ncbi:hypothetical protein [Algicella marina]|uniref:Uncharacterized protein n=1 Tax=Algicella marina TaxID=2683284 RepID=A0A6P1T1J5_9RHOB|nr:hypothetical protein [Algicella marina]QHQ36784.1 hypothetical protein GO499_17165 [Algicella marina]